MAKRDFYEVLGVSKTASADELKKSYRKKAMEYHPDRNPDDKVAEQQFKEVSAAYEVLRDDQKRAAYDRFGHQAFEGGGHPGGGRPGGGPQAGFDFNFSSGGVSDLFEEVFGDFMGGGQRGGRASQRGRDLQYNLSVTLANAFAGGERNIEVPTYAACEPCHGSGAKAGSDLTACSTCNGRGKVRSQQGFFTIERTCPTCGGVGKYIEEKCESCVGMGRVRQQKNLKISIPPGVEDGIRIRLSGEGEAGIQGAPNGDLYVFIAVEAHELFQREGPDIHCQVPIAMTTAALGGSIEVPTIDGKRTRVKIPEGTQSGRNFRLKGKGMTILRRIGRGDMFVHVLVETPVKMTKKQKQLLQEFKEDDKGANTSPQSQGFFTKVKDFWDNLQE